MNCIRRTNRPIASRKNLTITGCKAGLKEIKSLLIVNKNVALKNNSKEILLLNISLFAAAEAYKKTVSEFLYWQWLVHLVSGKRPENEQKVPQGKNGEDGLNWYVYVNNNPVNFIDPTGLESVDAAYSRNNYLSNENPILFHNEQIIRLQNERIETNTKIDSSKNQINILYGEIDEARMGYYGKVLKRGWDIATFAYYKENNSFDGMLDSLTNALSGEVYEDNPLLETVGIEIENMKEISDIKKYVGSKNEELEKINSGLESHLQQLAEYPKEKSNEECNN